MAGQAAETVIGAVVLAVAGGFFVYAAQSASVGVGPGYELVAKFRKAEGVSVGADVRVSGVKVGSVTDMALDRTTYQAVLTLSVEEGLEVPEDSAAVVSTEGVLGGTFIAIEPGGAEFLLAAGDEFQFTQGSVNLFELLGKFVSDDGG